MSKKCNHSDILLKRNGTDQSRRFVEALDPASVKLHDLSLEDWMEFAYQFAESVNYFSTLTNTTSGHWQDFFLEKETVETLLSDIEKDNDLTPHLALFACFLKLIEFSQKRINNVTKRHLDFYYKEVLSLKHKEAVSDQVHVLFELAKKATEVKVDKGTELDAGKDVDGNKMVFTTDEEIVVSKAQVSSIKNVYHYPNKGVKYSDVANSSDGLGEGFPDDQVQWWPFGHPDHQTHKQIEEGYPSLPNAKIGFSVASPILLLSEGLREVTFSITFNSNLSGFSKQNLTDSVNVFFSGEKEWIPAQVDINGSSVSGKTLKLKVILSEALDAIVPYNQEALGEFFTSVNPVARFLLKNEETKKGYSLYKTIRKKKVQKIKIDVTVSDMQNLIIENDLGRLDASKPFHAFGPQPVKGSNLYIGCQEALNKQWSNINFDLTWKDTPLYGDGTNPSGIDHFKEHYIAYRDRHLKNLGKNTYTLNTDNYTNTSLDEGLIVDNDETFQVKVSTLEDKKWEDQDNPDGGPTFTLFNNSAGSYQANISFGQPTTSPSDFEKVEVSGPIIIPIFGGGFGIGGKFANDKLASTIEKNFGFEGNTGKIVGGVFDLFANPIQQESFSASAKKGFIRVSLQQSFLHDLFPKIYAVALSKQEYFEQVGSSWEARSALVPNEPYTPIVETMRLGYSATTTKTFNQESKDEKGKLTDYLDENVELFHEGPFGQAEQHPFLKSQHDFLNNNLCTLVPNYEYGELYIGIENAEQLQLISLLIQVLEGSENPEYEGAQTYQNDEVIAWDILSDNEWKPLNENYIVSNNTDNILKSGIVKVSIPKEATNDNTLLPKDLFWIRLTNVKEFDAVCQAVNIHTQAQLATFFDKNNNLAHLETGLPEGTISKMVERLATLKGVSQPYSSFGGVPKETDEQFYRRVSERLRHKQRAITIWDYEHLVLQQFPNIYKANCLKHTSKDSELSPGDVTVIVIPNIINQNIFDIYKPRISKAKRNEIQTFINALNTLHVDAAVDNPTYQEVRVALKVKFYEGRDENFYAKELQRDITKFLAPWAYEETAEINFGLTLHKSVMIHYIEKLEYVDYIKDFELQVENGKVNSEGDKLFDTVDKVIPANSRVILTSVKWNEHVIKEVISIKECELA